MNAAAPAAASHRLDDAALRAWPLPMPHPEGDKETRGRVLIVAGSREIPGAAILAAQAALRAGAGKMMIATAASVATAVAVAAPETRVVGVRETGDGGFDPAGAAAIAHLAGRCGALLIGPGLQEDEASRAFVRALIGSVEGVPIILDAAGMDAVACARADAEPVLITPHAGEMAHLSGEDKADIQADPQAHASAAARRWRAVVALKGATTVLAHPDGNMWWHEAGNIGLATAGSGDVLAGLIVGFAARGAPLEQAAAWGVALHARAGERVARRVGGLGYLARELSAEVPSLLESFCIGGPA